MTRRLISSGSPFESIAGYSRAVVDGDFVFVAGTTGYDYATMIMPDTVEEQARNCLRTIARVLDEAGFALADVVRATYYLVDIANADRVLRSSASSLAPSPGRDPGGGDGTGAAGDEDRDRGHRQAAELAYPGPAARSVAPIRGPEETCEAQYCAVALRRARFSPRSRIIAPASPSLVRDTRLTSPPPPASTFQARRRRSGSRPPRPWRRPSAPGWRSG
jgi:enamine deaminase RidA (YjgF/YER057c/UK114 family)